MKQEKLWNIYEKKMKRKRFPRTKQKMWEREEAVRRLTRMPWPSSETWMSLRPPSLTTTFMEEEQASRLFSTSSLTAETGRWITSPAAIRFTTESFRRWILGGSIGTCSSSASISISIFGRWTLSYQCAPNSLMNCLQSSGVPNFPDNTPPKPELKNILIPPENFTLYEYSRSGTSGI